MNINAYLKILFVKSYFLNLEVLYNRPVHMMKQTGKHQTRPP